NFADVVEMNVGGHCSNPEPCRFLLFSPERSIDFPATTQRSQRLAPAARREGWGNSTRPPRPYRPHLKLERRIVRSRRGQLRPSRPAPKPRCGGRVPRTDRTTPPCLRTSAC